MEQGQRTHFVNLSRRTRDVCGGLYRVKDGQTESVILTTEPNELVEPIHNRMPLIIDKKDARDWLENTEKAAALLHKADESNLVLQKIPKDKS